MRSLILAGGVLLTLGLALPASAQDGIPPLQRTVDFRDASMNDRFGTSTAQGARRFTVPAGATSAGMALDAIVRAHGAALWEVREGDVGRAIYSSGWIS
jgi:hypothetical protein